MDNDKKYILETSLRLLSGCLLLQDPPPWEWGIRSGTDDPLKSVPCASADYCPLRAVYICCLSPACPFGANRYGDYGILGLRLRSLGKILYALGHPNISLHLTEGLPPGHFRRQGNVVARSAAYVNSPLTPPLSNIWRYISNAFVERGGAL